MPSIDQFIDVDLAEEADVLGFIKGDNGAPTFGDPGPFAEDTSELIPESRWKELADAAQAQKTASSWLVNWVLNQRNEGSCVGFAFTQGDQVLQAKAFGRENATHMSGVSTYKQIGSSPNSGAMVSDGQEAVMTTGILPLRTPENQAKFKHTFPENGFRTPFPDGWKETAANFRINESHVIRSIAGLVTALLKREPVIVGRSGHSICYLDVIYKGNDLYVKYVNSWGSWGGEGGEHSTGFGLDSLRMIRSSASWAAVLRTPVVPSFISQGI